MDRCRTADEVRALAFKHSRKPSTPVVVWPRQVVAPLPQAARAPEPVPAPVPQYARLTMHDVICVVAWAYKIHPDDITGPSRVAAIVLPRQVAMYVARDVLKRSFPEIGRRFGNRDHTTALHATRKIERLLQADEALASDVAAIKIALGVSE